MGAKAEPSTAGEFEVFQLFNHLVEESGNDPDLAQALSDPKKPRRRTKQGKPGQVRVLKTVPIDQIQPSPENDRLYRPIRNDDPEILDMADSIRTYGLREPLVITLDDFILSGHRRFAACKLAGLKEVPVFVEQVTRTHDPDRFLRLLREYNRQRTKTFDEVVREEVISLNEEEVYEALIDHREAASAVKVKAIKLADRKKRHKISPAKMPMLEARRAHAA
jgi:ParB-like chromosome segregation protein Spo0J